MGTSGTDSSLGSSLAQVAGSDDPAWLDLGPSDVASSSNDERSQTVLQAYYDERSRNKGTATDKSRQPTGYASASTAAANRRAGVGRAARSSIEPTKLFATDMLAVDTAVA